jgi:serine/threonine protein kinase
VLKLNAVAQDRHCVYMFVDFMPAGDLMKVINKFGKLDSEKARFYTAQIVHVLQFLHETKSMVFRDLKPENILVD